MAHADRWAITVAIPMQVVARIGSPLVWLLRFSTEALLRLLPKGGSSQSAVTDDDVRALATEGMQTGALHRHEAEMIDSVLRLADRSIGSIMVPRGDNYNTMAGFVLWHLGRMPVAGEKLAWRDLSIEVIDMDGLVIDKLLVMPRAAQGLHAGQENASP
jgi:CBS domain containing-hemolysin-like protein